ncbi:hypothetical protein HYU21_00205 [Candidatus Woesearchaeota archaeon]|nr:hypothetical protein [Candidatus Woesearchaeota archaeon]
MKNIEIAKIFNSIADILEFQNVQWKPQAYRKAARVLESLTEDVEDLLAAGKLEELPGIGEHLAKKIEELISTGKSQYYEKLKKDIPVEMENLNAIPFLGPKKIKVLYQQLKIKNIDDLEKAILEKKVRELPGFGEETEKRLKEGLDFLKTNPRRFLYTEAAIVGNYIISVLKRLPEVQKAVIAGSFIRGKETVGDLDILVVAGKAQKNKAQNGVQNKAQDKARYKIQTRAQNETQNAAQKVMKFFNSLPEVKKILGTGETKSSVRLKNGMQVDLRVVEEKQYGSALNYFTGNKEHNIELRKLALSKGYTLSEYGLFKVKDKKWIAGIEEKDIYEKLGLQYIPVEMRENTGEISAAKNNRLPKLVQEKEINGVFHNHSTWSDGSNSLLEMAQEAEKLGLKFISFNDHYGTVKIANPIPAKKLQKYLQDIEKVRKKVGLCVFSGLEIDILKDGKLPLPKSKLKELDVVAASVHMSLRMPETEMTARVCRALDNYPINILAHPTNRLLNEREPLALNLEKVFEMAKQKNTFLEINCQPKRMDLSGLQIKAGKEAGCKFAISTDAHRKESLSNWGLGVMTARRGWLEKKDILNCWSLPEIEKALRK